MELITLQQLELFINQIPVQDIIHETVITTNENQEKISNIIHVFINETRTTFSLVQNYLSPETTILEIGAGLCFFSLFLKQKGFKITALEPASGGYDIFNVIKKIILNKYSSLQLPIIENKAEELSLQEHGVFDLIFSNNVLEHIPNLNNALDAMLAVLSPQGKMIHNCPNYLIPYEPHFSIPVIKPIKYISEKIFKTKIDTMRDIWDSLNFVTYLTIKKYAKNNLLQCHFKKGVLYQILTRIDNDPYFKQRHSKGLFIYIFYTLKYTGLLKILKYLPASFSTPMIFELKRES